MQAFPPFWGGGLEHVLVRIVLPFPQDVLHSAQGDQTAQMPSTEMKMKKYTEFIYPHVASDCCLFVHFFSLIEFLAVCFQWIINSDPVHVMFYF